MVRFIPWGVNFMLRLFPVLIASLLAVSVAGPQVPQQPAKPTLTWWGQSFFVLKTAKGTLVAFDPHAIAEFKRAFSKTSPKRATRRPSSSKVGRMGKVGKKRGTSSTRKWSKT
jgi:hypothetical protein